MSVHLTFWKSSPLTENSPFARYSPGNNGILLRPCKITMYIYINIDYWRWDEYPAGSTTTSHDAATQRKSFNLVGQFCEQTIGQLTGYPWLPQLTVINIYIVKMRLHQFKYKVKHPERCWWSRWNIIESRTQLQNLTRSCYASLCDKIIFLHNEMIWRLFFLFRVGGPLQPKGKKLTSK